MNNVIRVQTSIFEGPPKIAVALVAAFQAVAVALQLMCCSRTQQDKRKKRDPQKSLRSQPRHAARGLVQNQGPGLAYEMQGRGTKHVQDRELGKVGKGTLDGGWTALYFCLFGL